MGSIGSTGTHLPLQTKPSDWFFCGRALQLGPKLPKRSPGVVALEAGATLHAAVDTRGEGGEGPGLEVLIAEAKGATEGATKGATKGAIRKREPELEVPACRWIASPRVIAVPAHATPSVRVWIGYTLARVPDLV